MGQLTTHVLDTMNGCPAAGMAVALWRIGDAAPLRELVLDADGRADGPLLTAAAFVSMAVPLVVFFALQRYFVRGLLAGAVKG